MNVYDSNPLDLSLSRRRLGALAAGGGATALIGTTRVAAQSATPVASPVALTEEQQGWIEQASRGINNGWLHVRIQGAPFARGFQHGYLTAAEYAEAIRVYTEMTYQTTGIDYAFFVDKAVEYHKDKITPELTGRDGRASPPATPLLVCPPRSTRSSAGTPTWRSPATGGRPSPPSTSTSAPSGNRKSHCSAFMATGSATTDGQIVIGHESFTEFWNGQYHERDPRHHPG